MDGKERVGSVTVPLNPPRDGEGDRDAKRRGGGGSRSLRRPEIYDARKARRAMSLPEVLMWQRLKGSPHGIRFRKQHPIGIYRADFYCAAARLVIEIDGMAHDMGDRPQRDEIRTKALQNGGYSVVRIAAAEVLRDPDQAAQSIVSLVESPLHHPADGPPPRAGEDLQ